MSLFKTETCFRQHYQKDLSSSFTSWSEQIDKSNIVFFCIGTDRSTGDSLGPLVGTFLKDSGFTNVYGTLEDPVHAVNLEEKLQEVNEKFSNPTIISIDSALGQLSSIGYITLDKGPIHPGAGVKKVLPAVGDYHISAIVNVGGFMEFFVLQNTRLSVVMGMAKAISENLVKQFQPAYA